MWKIWKVLIYFCKEYWNLKEIMHAVQNTLELSASRRVQIFKLNENVLIWEILEMFEKILKCFEKILRKKFKKFCNLKKIIKQKVKGISRHPNVGAFPVPHHLELGGGARATCPRALWTVRTCVYVAVLYLPIKLMELKHVYKQISIIYEYIHLI